MPSKVAKEVGWTPPPPGWHKLNTNGSGMGNPGATGAGGVLRNSLGQWEQSYSRNLGRTNNSASELWGLRDGLAFAKSLNIQKLEIEIDATLVSNLVNQLHPDRYSSFFLYFL